MIKIVAVLCLISTGVCKEQTVTTSDYADLTMSACLVGEPSLVEWFMKSFPQYRLAGWKCQIGARKGNA